MRGVEPLETTWPNRDLILRLERTWATDEVRRADALGRIDPSLGSETFAVGDGWAVLTGPGQYVNRVLAAGLDGSVDPMQIDRFEDRARVTGVPPMFDVSELVGSELVGELERRGYVEAVSVTAVAMRLGAEAVVETAPGVAVERFGPERLSEWQELSAQTWGQVEPAARSVSDVFAAARAAAGELLFVARDAVDGRPLGTASVALTERVATLGAMATLPTERRRGVQRALVAHRLGVARGGGCDLASSTARTGGDSLRNLVRLGFTPTHLKRLVRRD